MIIKTAIQQGAHIVGGNVFVFAVLVTPGWLVVSSDKGCCVFRVRYRKLWKKYTNKQKKVTVNIKIKHQIFHNQNIVGIVCYPNIMMCCSQQNEPSTKLLAV